MTNPQLGINTEIGADIPLKLNINACYLPCGSYCDRGSQCFKNKFGGCVAINILDKGEKDYTQINSEGIATFFKNTIMRNKIIRYAIPLKLKQPTKFNNSIIMLDKDHKRVLSKNQKNLLRIILIIVLLQMLYKYQKGYNKECKQIIFMIFILLCFILSGKL